MGALYVGAMVTAILYGSTNVQTFLYYKNFRRDQMFQKCAVALLWLLESLHMIFAIVEGWHYLIDSFGDYAALLELHWSFSLQILISAIIILVVQSLYTRRIWILSMNHNQRIWSWILVVVVLAGYAGGFFFFVELYRSTTILQLSQLRWLMILGFAFASFEDLILAITICVFLSLGRTTFKETKSIIWTIMTYAVISGALTSICSLIFVVTLAVMPHNLREVNIFCQSLYVNSYLAMLNARESMRDHIKSSNGPVSMIEFGEFESRHLTSTDPCIRVSD